MTTLLGTTRIYAHRGFSSRQPEMTLAAYEEAIDWSLAQGVPLGLECDVHFTADDQIVCLHDAHLGRTVQAFGPVEQWTLSGLRALDFGSWKVPTPSPAQRSLVTLDELVALVCAARLRGAEVELAIETKHPQRRGLELERRVHGLLGKYGWTGADAPVRLITFSVEGAELLARLAPEMKRTLLIESSLGAHSRGALPEGITVAGVDVRLLRQDPDFVSRAHRHGNEVHAWTVNDWSDIRFCRDLGVTGFTSDYPDRVLEVLSTSGSELFSDRRSSAARSMSSTAA